MQKLKICIVLLGLIFDISSASISWSSLFGYDKPDPPSPNKISTDIPPKMPILYPVYQLRPIPVGVAPIVNYGLPLTTSTTPKSTIESSQDSFPEDLVQIVKELGLKDLSKMPKLSELGDMIGTGSPEETISFLREFASTSDGRDVIKSYIDTNEAEEVIPTTTAFPAPRGRSMNFDSAEVNLELLSKMVSTPKPEMGIFEKIAAYSSYFDFIPKETPMAYSVIDKTQEQLNGPVAYQQYPQYPFGVSGATPPQGQMVYWRPMYFLRHPKNLDIPQKVDFNQIHGKK